MHGLRSSLAIAILLALGIFLILVGFIKLPYIAVETQTVAVITSNTYKAATTYTSATTIINTLEQALTSEKTYLNTITKLETTAYTKLNTRELLNMTTLITPDNPMIAVGPLYTDGAGLVRVFWVSDKTVELLVVDAAESVKQIYLNSTGSEGVEEITFNSSSLFYLVVENKSKEPTYVRIRVYFEQTIPVTSIYTTRVVETSVSTYVYTTTIYSGYTSVATLVDTVTTKTVYPTTVVKQVTQTRYQELTFSTAMGVFLVFASVMFIILLRRLRYVEEEAAGDYLGRNQTEE